MALTDETPNSSVLVIGADGLVGQALSTALTASGRFVYRTTRRASQRATHLFLDLTDPSLESTPLPQADTAVFCAAMNGFASCRTDPEGAYQVNVKATSILARRLVAQGCRVIYLSSSAVFDFRHPHVQASSPVCPTTVYGELKALAESHVLALGPLATVVRLTKVLTPDTPRFNGWLKALALGHRVTAFSDLHFCPISVDFAVRALTLILRDRRGGIFQVSGADDISYSDAIRYLATKMGFPEARIIVDRAVNHGIPSEEIATFTSLNMARYTALTGDLPPNPLDVLDLVYGAQIQQAAV